MDWPTFLFWAKLSLIYIICLILLIFFLMGAYRKGDD